MLWIKMAGHMLMNRGKRNAATYIKAEYQTPNGHQHLNDLLDCVLDTKSSIDDFENIDWCRWLIAGGVTYEEFTKTGADNFSFSVKVKHVKNASFVLVQ